MARVLVVDDLPDMRKVAAMLVRAAGHEVVTADGGATAIDLVRKDPPDVILLDLSMPDVDGFAVLEALQQRQRSGDPPIPVVVLSALDDEKSRARAIELGASDYLVKGTATFLDMLGDITQRCSKPAIRPVQGPHATDPAHRWARNRRSGHPSQGPVFRSTHPHDPTGPADSR